MEKLKLMSKTFTLTRRETGPLKQPSYRVCKDGKFYYFSLEKDFEELVERYSKLQRIRKLRESEILADFIKWTRSLIGELEKIKQKQAEFEARVNKLMMRIFKLEVRTANERKTP